MKKPRKTKLGRKTLLNSALQKQLCDLLAASNTVKSCCDSVGISERVFYEWCERKPHFAQATACARARGKIRLVKLVTDAALTDWRSAAWLLERRWPNEYGRVERALDSQSQEVQTSVQFILNHGGKQQPITMEQAMHLFLPPCQVKTVVPAPSAESGDKDIVDDATGTMK